MSKAASEGDRSLSIVIPAYNEGRRIAAGLSSVLDYLSAPHRDAEIIVVDDGSTDDTVAVCHSVLEKSGVAHGVITGRENRGKGYSVREGALLASKTWTLVSDADLSTPVAEADRLLDAALAGGHALTMGSRALAGSRIGVRQSWVRQTMGRTFNRIVRMLTGLSIRDTQCGFKLWHTERMQPILQDLEVDGFAWDVELLMAVRRAKLSMEEIPVEWNDVTGSKVGMVHDSLRMLLDVVRIRLRG